MDLNYNIPLPVNLNCWKHHAGFIKEQIPSIQKGKIIDSELRKILRIIGETQMDIYLGKYSPSEIAKEVLSELLKREKLEIRNYKNWLSKEGKDYKLLKISDNSVWTLRLGNEKERYIHIHPGRYSPVTIRVKSTTLKTFIASEIMLAGKENEEDVLGSINKIRVKYLQLPPLNSLSSSTGLFRLKKIFDSIKSEPN